jgi:hypothetical protein
LKWLIQLQEAGRETFSEAQLGGFIHLQVLLLDDLRAPASARFILPGLRHVSGIKEWGAYQKAKAVFLLRETGAPPQEVAQSLGLSTREANKLWRAYIALENMRQDEEYGELVEPTLYSYFEEAFKRSNVKDWLQWSDTDRKYMNADRLREFYGWMLGERTDEGDLDTPKLPQAKSVRDLGKIIDDPGAMSAFRAPDGSLSRALARFEIEHPEAWLPNITAAESVLASLAPDTLRAMNAAEIAALEGLQLRINQVLHDRIRLVGG